jgi:hypothetical protein
MIALGLEGCHRVHVVVAISALIGLTEAATSGGADAQAPAISRIPKKREFLRLSHALILFSLKALHCASDWETLVDLGEKCLSAWVGEGLVEAQEFVKQCLCFAFHAQERIHEHSKQMLIDAKAALEIYRWEEAQRAAKSTVRSCCV